MSTRSHPPRRHPSEPVPAPSAVFGVGARRAISSTVWPALNGLRSPGCHVEQHLHGLGTHASPDQTRPGFRPRILGGIQVVDLGHITGRSGQEHDNHVLAERAANRLFQVVNVVGRNATGTRCGMAGEVDDAAEQLALFVPSADHAHFRIGRSRWFDNIWVALPRMCERETVTHAKAPVEGHLVFDALARSTASSDARRIRLADSLH